MASKDRRVPKASPPPQQIVMSKAMAERLQRASFLADGAQAAVQAANQAFEAFHKEKMDCFQMLCEIHNLDPNLNWHVDFKDRTVTLDLGGPKLVQEIHTHDDEDENEPEEEPEPDPEPAARKRRPA